MAGLAMPGLLPRGSLLWLVAHELRLSMRAVTARSQRGPRLIGMALMIGYIVVGMLIGWGFRAVPIPYTPIAGDMVLLAAIGMFSFMITQAVLGSQRSLYEVGDLDLLLSAPLAERTILRAKLIGIASALVLTYAVLLLPIIVPLALFGHPALLGAAAVVLAVALTAACTGLAITLGLASIAGPRAARTVGQIAAALLGGAVFIVSQILSRDERQRDAGHSAIFDALRGSGIGRSFPGALPGQAAFGDPLAIAVLLGGALLLFAITGTLFQRSFVANYHVARMRLSRATPSRRGIARHFHRTLTGTIVAKEILLLRRDPALAFQVLLRLIYLAPLALAGMGSKTSIPLAPGLAFASVLVVGQLVGSLAFLTIAAEDTPDLISVAPVSRERINRAKLIAALAMAAPLAIILPVAVGLQSPVGGGITLAMTGLAGIAAGVIELALGKPTPRASFNRRRSGGAIAGIAAGAATLLIGAAAGLLVYIFG